jgi:peptidoglycan/LPS O-acetylase OafA/YrhL
MGGNEASWVFMHNNNINTLRFLGAFLVLFGHAFDLCYGPRGGFDPVSESLMGFTAYHAKLPGIGVALFFVLSGYLVTRSFENRQSLRAYVEARVLRIFPALWVTLLLTVLVLGPLVTTLELTAYFTHQGTWKYLLHNAKLFPDVMYRLPGVFLENPWPGGVNGSLWTLPVEVRMYMIVAFMGVMGFLRRSEIFNLIGLLIVAWYLLVPEHFVLLHDLKHARLGVYFLLGALLYMNRDTIIYHWIGVAVLSALLFLSFGKSSYDLVFAAWFSYLILYISFHRSIRFPDLGKYGDFSYGLYLYAFPMTQLNIFLFGPENPWFIVLVTSAATMVLAVASWFFIEQPFMRLKGLYLRR